MTRKATNTAVAVAVPQTLSPAELAALLQQTGDLPQASSDFRRMRLDGGMLVTLDSQGEVEEMFPPKFVKGVPQPALTVRIVEPPVYFNAIWLGAETDERGQPTGAVDPNRIGRPDLNKMFSKRFDDPSKQAADRSPANDVYDDLVAVTGNRGGFKADLKVQVVPESGQMVGDEPVFTLTLSSSSALDWRGTRKNPTGGVVQEKNFIIQLAEFAASAAAEAGGDAGAQQLAVTNAMTALRLGGVVADVYILQAQNEDGSRKWPVIAFKPVHVEPLEEAPALEAGGDEPLAQDPDDIGF